MVLTFETSVDEILQCDLLNETYHWVLLFYGTVVILYKVVLTFESVDEILQCDLLNETYHWVLLFYGTVYYAEHSGFNF